MHVKKKTFLRLCSVSGRCCFSDGQRFGSIDHASMHRPRNSISSKKINFAGGWFCHSWKVDWRERWKVGEEERGGRTVGDGSMYARTRTPLLETQFVNEDTWFCSTNRIPFRCTRDATEQNTADRAPASARSPDYPAPASPRPSFSSSSSSRPGVFVFFSSPPRSSLPSSFVRTKAPEVVVVVSRRISQSDSKTSQ